MSATHTDGLPRLDLNLLVAFDLLVQERSVTKAAERAGVTQSAMSHTLRRLREAFGDELLVRGGGGMLLTPRAEKLVGPIRSGLVALERAVHEPDRFDPRTSKRTFRFVAPDLFDVVALPRILERLGRAAPGVDVGVVPRDPTRLLPELETGELDFVILPLPLDEGGRELPELAAPGLARRTLFHDSYRCFLRGDHPVFATRKTKRLTVAAFCKLSHAMVSPTGTGDGVVDRYLRAQGRSRRVALRIPSFYAAPAIIARTDLVLTAPTTLSRVLPAASPVIAVPPPIALPSHAIALVWHERYSNDPGHKWFRTLVAEVFRDDESVAIS